jgi:PAS domain S-box-containing protein
VATHDAGRTKEHFFDLSLDLLCIQGFDGYFKEVNPAWEATLGFMPEELKARPSISFVHPLDREATLAENHRIEDGLDTVSFENRYVCRDGSFKWLAWTAKGVPEEGLIYGVARDITDRKQREDALSESEAGFRLLAEALERQTWTLREQAQILDLAYDAILVRDMSGRIIFWNRGAEELYGWAREEALGQVSHELLRTRFPTSRQDVEAEVLDLAAWARDALALALPAQVVCRDDCAGLCPLCGENLNTAGPDHHHERAPDPRWAKLRELRLE